MFDSLQEGLSNAFRSLTGKARLSEANMREGLQLVERALLEADVSYSVVKDFIASVSQEAVGERVLKAVKPVEQLVGLVYQELVQLMGPVDHSLHLQGEMPVIMMCGLQGSGKTTTCGKLARYIKEKGRKPLLVAADLQRPAAIDQLHILGEQLNVPVYSERGSQDPVAVCQNAVKHAKQIDAHVVILDTAGRLHIDEELMKQLERIDKFVKPQQVLLVVDGMTGQDAVNSAKAFNEALELDGVIMTKLDGDSRGGAALSVKSITGVPIKFIGVGEHLDALEEFHPERLASRILGMGDVVTLVQKAQAAFDQDEMAKAESRMREGAFDLDDFRKIFSQTTKMGSFGKLLDLIPGMGSMRKMLAGVDADSEAKRLMAIIDSMTPAERRDPTLLDQSRRRRIGAGAGAQPHEVNELVKQFDVIAGVMKGMAGKSIGERMKMFRDLQTRGAFSPGASMAAAKGSTGKRLTPDERRQQKKAREKELRKMKRTGRNPGQN